MTTSVTSTTSKMSCGVPLSRSSTRAMQPTYHAGQQPFNCGRTRGNLPFARMLKPVEKQRVAEEIAEQLRSLILNGQYPPGSKLPPERELSKRLRVNRASLREALK